MMSSPRVLELPPCGKGRASWNKVVSIAHFQAVNLAVSKQLTQVLFLANAKVIYEKGCSAPALYAEGPRFNLQVRQRKNSSLEPEKSLLLGVDNTELNGPIA